MAKTTVTYDFGVEFPEGVDANAVASCTRMP